jgi:hypothetical protein
MIDLKELKRLALDFIRLDAECGEDDNHIPVSKALSAFECAATPHMVSDLIDRLERAQLEPAALRKACIAALSCAVDNGKILQEYIGDQAVEKAQIPTGWKLVPIDLNDDMIDATLAGTVQVQCVTTQMRHREYLRENYRKQLNAAPSAPILDRWTLIGAVPDGWKLMPVKLTNEMVLAAAKDHEGEFYLPHSIYESFQKSAPSAPIQG